MKTSTFIVTSIAVIIFSCFTLNSISQPYKSIFGNFSTQWNELFSSLSTCTCVLNVTKDTIIDGKTYKKAIYNGEYCPQYGSGVFLREDSTAGTAWVIDLADNQERLIMDLSLNIGDTFRIYPNAIYYDTIAIVDSVYFENSLKKVRLNLISGVNSSERLTFIEGVGSNFGIDYQINPFAFGGGVIGGDIYLLCSYKDGILTYKNLFIDTCYWVSADIDEISNTNKIKVYPNPTKDFLNIQTYDFVEKTIIIYNSIGQMVQSLDFMNHICLNISSLEDGLYLVNIIDMNNYKTPISNLKFIKK